MNQDILNNNWFIVAESRQLKSKPMAVTFNDSSIVIYRANNQVVALQNTCPHRGVPLSEGQIINEQIQCCYHGWKFNSFGKLTCVPGVTDSALIGKISVAQFNVQEVGGFIWLCLNENTEQTPFLPSSHNSYPYSTLSRIVKANAFDILENFLDPLHTHTIHSGIIRDKDTDTTKRSKSHIHIKQIDGGYEAIYKDEEIQSGIISRLFGSNITHTVGRIRTPGIVELEYCSAAGIELLVTVYVTPISDGVCRVQLTSYIKPNYVPYFLKSLILTPFQLIAIRQDINILELQRESTKKLKKFSPIVTKHDVMAKCIKNVLSGKNNEIDTKIELML